MSEYKVGDIVRVFRLDEDQGWHQITALKNSKVTVKPIMSKVVTTILQDKVDIIIPVKNGFIGRARTMTEGKYHFHVWIGDTEVIPQLVRQ